MTSETTESEIDFAAAEARARLYANVIGVEPPARLLCSQGGPSRDLLDFHRRYGASLDWIFLGDMRQMIRDSYARALA
jgi:hypothetical protein